MNLPHRLRHPVRVVALVAATLFCMSTAAGAATDGGTPLQPGWNIHSATVVCPGAPQRTLTSVQAATFLQAWLPDAIYTKLKTQDPPPGVTRCTVTVPWTITGEPAQTPAQIGYASDGTHVWVRLPPATKWSIPRQTQRVIDSFLGHGTYVPVATVPTTASPTVTTAPKPNPTHHSSNAWVWVVGAAAVVVIVLAGIRARSGRAAPRRSSSKPAAASTKRRR